MLKTKDLYDLTHTKAAPILENTEYPWEALDKIKDFIIELGKTLPKDEYDEVSENVWIAKDAKIYPNNYIGAPAIIGHETEVRPGAFVRGSALVPRYEWLSLWNRLSVDRRNKAPFFVPLARFPALLLFPWHLSHPLPRSRLIAVILCQLGQHPLQVLPQISPVYRACLLNLLLCLHDLLNHLLSVHRLPSVSE